MTDIRETEADKGNQQVDEEITELKSPAKTKVPKSQKVGNKI